MNSPTPASSAHIGMLDSGVGGWSVLVEVDRLLPQVPIHYVGDSARCPYGTKSPEQICERVFAVTDYLLSRGATMIVVACNSATIHAVGALRAAYPVPIIGMEPGVKPAAELTVSGVIGVLATEASIAGEKFHQLVNTHAAGVRVITRTCPRFVELVEAGQLEGPEAEAAVAEALAPLIEVGADVIVLGCTHYPFLRPLIESCLPEGVRLVDTGPAVARRVVQVLGGNLPPHEGSVAFRRVETTGGLERLGSLAPRLMPQMAVTLGVCAIP